MSKVYNSSDYRSLTPAARAVFKQVVETLTDKGLFDEADMPVIASYARNVVLARKAAEDIEKFGAVITYIERGFEHVKTNPAITVMQQAQKAYQDTAVKLGLTPAGRKKFKGEGVAPKTALDKFNEEFE